MSAGLSRQLQTALRDLAATSDPTSGGAEPMDVDIDYVDTFMGGEDHGGDSDGVDLPPNITVDLREILRLNRFVLSPII